MNQPNRTFQAYVGHLIDILDVAMMRVKNPHSYTKFRIIKSAKKATKSKNLIETGTYLGVTTKRCAPVFDRVDTIELDEDLANQAKENLSTKKNVTVHQGDGIQLVEKILKETERKDFLIFLDGHFSGGVTACGDNPEPAIEELVTISKYIDKVNAIVIDDFRLFGVEEGYPLKSELFKAIENLFIPQGFVTSVFLDMVLISRVDK